MKLRHGTFSFLLNVEDNTQGNIIYVIPLRNFHNNYSLEILCRGKFYIFTTDISVRLNTQLYWLIYPWNLRVIEEARLVVHFRICSRTILHMVYFHKYHGVCLILVPFILVHLHFVFVNPAIFCPLSENCSLSSAPRTILVLFVYCFHFLLFGWTAIPLVNSTCTEELLLFCYRCCQLHPLFFQPFYK